MGQMITHPKQIQRKSRYYEVRRVGPNWYKVSIPASNREYDVNLGLNGGTCTCPWGRFRPAYDHRSGCSHVVAALAYRAQQQGRHISVWASEQDARRQHRPMVKIGDGLIVTSRPN
jgi:hypothetical protein